MFVLLQDQLRGLRSIDSARGHSGGKCQRDGAELIGYVREMQGQSVHVGTRGHRKHRFGVQSREKRSKGKSLGKYRKEEGNGAFEGKSQEPEEWMFKGEVYACFTDEYFATI